MTINNDTLTVPPTTNPVAPRLLSSVLADVDAPLLDEPIRLTGGQWAEIYRLRLGPGRPADWPEDLVLRIAPDEQLARKENAVQTAVAAAGIKTPAIRRSGSTSDLVPDRDGGMWVLMDFDHGTSWLDGLDIGSLLMSLPRLLRAMPDELAATLTAVHRLDPDPVRAGVREAAPGAAFTVDELFTHLVAAARATGRRDLVEAAERLETTRPDPRRTVICHGDFHPLNLLVGADDAVTVLDWTGAIEADPAYDVAFTQLLLTNPPLVVPAPLRPVIRGAASFIGRRFVRRYRNANPTLDPASLAWHRGFHAFRIVLKLCEIDAQGPGHDHAWRLLAPAAKRELEAATGVTIQT